MAIALRTPQLRNAHPRHLRTCAPRTAHRAPRKFFSIRLCENRLSFRHEHNEQSPQAGDERA
jgi:hypothetical protein